MPLTKVNGPAKGKRSVSMLILKPESITQIWLKLEADGRWSL